MMWRGCIDKKLCWWCVRSWDEIQIVHRGMGGGSRMADELYIQRVFSGVGGRPCLLSLLFLVYSKASLDCHTASCLVLSLFHRNDH